MPPGKTFSSGNSKDPLSEGKELKLSGAGPGFQPRSCVHSGKCKATRPHEALASHIL